MSILSIQSHVAFGYVGNKAAVYPLQNMGYDVWPVNTVQFSNHTGYGKWEGEIFSAKHIKSIVKGIEDIGEAEGCRAILSGYMGSGSICKEVANIVARFKEKNKKIVYLCDPVIGNKKCYVKPEVLEFFKANLKADIITPNQYEAEILSGVKIKDIDSLIEVESILHHRDIKTVVITGISFKDPDYKSLYAFVSGESGRFLVEVEEHDFKIEPSGTGDVFSAVFLGSFLSSKDSAYSLQNTVAVMDRLLMTTRMSESRELQVISVDYHLDSKKDLPDLIEI